MTEKKFFFRRAEYTISEARIANITGPHAKACHTVTKEKKGQFTKIL